MVKKIIHKRKSNKSLIWFSVLFTFCLLMVPFGAKTARLYLESNSEEYQPGDVFIAEIKIDNENECINTIKADLSFPQDVLQILDFSKGSSILTLWVEEPDINQESGLLSFTGGIPGGYSGKIPGDSGISNLLGKIIFRIKKSTKNDYPLAGQIGFLKSSQVLLNDGKGTLAGLNTEGIMFKITQPEQTQISRNEWQEQLDEDIIPPEPFILEVRKNEELFEGRYFLIFSTTDKQTGLDYYEIQETSDEQFGEWVRGKSPYLLKDQSLKSIIKVKAIDKAGNEKVIEITPPKPSVVKKKKISSWQILVLTILIIIAFWVLKKFKKRKKKYFHKTSLF